MTNRYLLDTHALLWWISSSSQLSATARTILGNESNSLYLSAASTWEMAIKTKLGKLHIPEPLQSFIPKIMSEQYLKGLPVEHAHSAQVETLPLHHRDPFDRLLVAQAMTENLTLVSCDSALTPYPVNVAW